MIKFIHNLTPRIYRIRDGWLIIWLKHEYIFKKIK